MVLQGGLATVQLAVGTPRISVVCVHGIGLAPETTWFDETSGASWIEEQDYNLAFGWPAQVMSFRYNSDIASNMSAASFAVHANELLYCLEQALARPSSCGVVFIAHGLGGIIVKKALSMRRLSKEWPRVRDAATSVCFLGTPHTDTDTDAVLKAVRRNIEMHRREHHNLDEDDVREFAAAVCSINATFPGLGDEPLRTLSFWETKPSTFKDPNGAGDCAELLFPQTCRKVGMRGNVDLQMNCAHSDMPHFPSRYNPRFIDFSKHLSGLVGRTLDYTASSLRAVDHRPREKTSSNGSQSKSPVPPEKVSKRKDRKGRPRVKKDQIDRVKSPISFWKERTRHEKQTADFDGFMKSLNGWTPQNTGQDILVAAGTCEWIPSDPAFRTWFNSRSQDTFSFISHPGSGKTHIAKAAAAYIDKVRTNDVVLSFFCGKDESTPRIWEYFTWSLLQARPSWFSSIPGKYEGRDINSEDLQRGDFVDIWTALRDAEANDQNTIWLIIDGLEQCGNDAFFHFWNSVEQVRKRPANLRTPFRFIKYLFTGGVSAATAAVAAIGTGIDVPNDKIMADISCYVDARLASIVDSTSTGDIKTRTDVLGSDIKAASMHYWPYARDAVNEVALSLAENLTKVKPFADRLPQALEAHARQTFLSLRQSVGLSRYLWPTLVVVLGSTLGSLLNVHQLKDALGALYGHDEVQEVDLASMLLHETGGLVGCFGSGGFDFTHPGFVAFLNQDIPAGRRDADAAYLCMKYLIQDCFKDLPKPDTLEEPWLWINDKYPFYPHAASYCLEYLAGADATDDRLPPLFVKLLLDRPHQWSVSRLWCHVIPEDLDIRTKYLSTLACTQVLSDQRLLPLLKRVCAPAYLMSAGSVSEQIYAFIATHLYPPLRGGAIYSMPSGWLRERNEQNRTPLLEAAFWCQCESLKYILSCEPDVNESGGAQERSVLATLFGSPGIENASQEALLSATEELLHRGANPNVGDKYGTTPLHIACARMDSSVVRLLLEHGAHVNISDMRGLTAWETACKHGKGDTMAVMMANGVEVDSWFSSGDTALTFLARKGKVDLLRSVLPSADVNALNKLGDAPIHVFMHCQERRHEILELLLSQRGLDVDHILRQIAGEDVSLVTPLLLAIESNDLQAAEMLLNAGASAGFFPGLPVLPLVFAVVCRSIDMVQLLLQHDAPVNEFIIDSKKRTAFSVAAETGNVDMIKLLLAHGADPTVEDGLGQTNVAMRIVKSRRRDLEALRLVLECPRPPNIVQNRGDQDQTGSGYSELLIESCRLADVRFMELLLDQEVELSAWLGCSERESPIHTAVRRNNIDHCRVLLEREPSLVGLSCKLAINEDEIDHHSPLHEACRKGYSDIVKLLLQKGGDVRQTTQLFKRSCLLLACMSSDMTTAVTVLDALGDDKSMLHLASYIGELPLEEAALNGDLELTELLLKAGASVTQFNEWGRTCIMTLLDGWTDAKTLPQLQLFIKYGSDINNHLSLAGQSAFHVALRYAPGFIVQWLSKQGGNPSRSHRITPALDMWMNGLHALAGRHQSLAAIDLLLEVHRNRLDEPDWARQNALGSFSHKLSPYLARLYWTCEDIRAETTRDVFAEMMIVPDIFGLTPLDRAMDVTSCRAEARSEAAGVILRLVNAYIDAPDVALLEVIMEVVTDDLKYEPREEIEPLLNIICSRPGIMPGEEGEDCMTASAAQFVRCDACDRVPFGIFFYCDQCDLIHCESCLRDDALEPCPRGEHLLHKVPLDASLTMESQQAQDALMKMRESLMMMARGDQSSPILEQDEHKLENKNEERRLQDSLQLATLHAFNMLAIRRPMWTEYLPISKLASELIAPFERNIAERRAWHERRMLDAEATVERRKEELRYMHRAFGRKAYADEELFMRELHLTQIEGLFQAVEEDARPGDEDTKNENHRYDEGWYD